MHSLCNRENVLGAMCITLKIFFQSEMSWGLLAAVFTVLYL